MKFIRTFLVFTICVIAISCTKKMYYNKVKANAAEFDSVLSYLQKNKFLELNDSLKLSNIKTFIFGSKCLYAKTIQDTLLSPFMNKYDLTRICFYKNQQDYYDSVIIFHKDYNPILGSSITINYDFGSSKLRNKINVGIKFPNQTAAILNDQYIFLSNSRPAFGE